MPGAERRSFSIGRAAVLRMALVGAMVTSLWAAAQRVTAEQKAAFLTKLSMVAIERASHVVRYDPAYVRIPYPNGDVPADRGVCSDEVVRSYRALGIDLQKEVHKDVMRDPAAYGLRRADANIDHRRVEHLMAFFRRHGDSLPTTRNAEDYQPGDIVTWDLHNGKGSVLRHIGIVVNRRPFWSNRYMILHNIGDGPKIEDVLFDWKVTGHYRYYGSGELLGAHSAGVDRVGNFATNKTRTRHTETGY